MEKANIAQIMAHQVMSTLAVVIDEQVVPKGSVVKDDVVTGLFSGIKY
ncbi:hypothetical protein C942_02857 [Photobacterium marinum]|uniref:Uncharacterized protein n=1 Tax=Photobacterium marinum TaxID=1056511 RepID=L8J631_9GAMM|nr:hypothetical protein C942_02857 [Photobacterium marinum]